MGEQRDPAQPDPAKLGSEAALHQTIVVSGADCRSSTMSPATAATPVPGARMPVRVVADRDGLPPRKPMGKATSSVVDQYHYRVRELAAAWNIDRRRIARLFENEPDVVHLPDARGRDILLIPESVAARVHANLSHKPLKAARTARNPLRIVGLRHSHGRVAKQPRDILNVKASKQQIDRERVS